MPTEQIEKITFKKLIMTVGNLPSSYVESLSYYECMLWLCNYLENTVIPAVNNNGEAVEELQGLYVELKEYVDTYFENLDVQEEINAKLDEMAEDGSLTTLISGYVDPIYQAYETQINGEISNFKTQVNGQISTISNTVQSVASGSPKGAYATVAALTAADPDHQYIYVVNADGHWYYYNTSTSSWADGGAYTSAVDDDTTALIQRNQVANLINIHDQVNFNENMFDGEYTHHFYLASDGTQSSDNPIFVSNKNLVAIPSGSTKIKFKLQEILNPLVSTYFLFYDEDNTYISYVQISGYNGSVNIPNNSAYLRFECQYTNNIDILDSKTMILNFQTEKDSRTYISELDYDVTKIKGKQNLLYINKPLTLESEVYNRSLVLTDLSGAGFANAKHADINVTAGQKYHIKTYSSYYYPAFSFVSENNTKIGDYYSISGDSEQGTQIIDYEFIIPDGCVKLYIDTLNSTFVDTTLEEIQYKNVGLPTLLQQKYIAFGDSISRGNHSNGTKSDYAWPELFGKMYNLDYSNESHGGQGYLNTQYYAETAYETIQATDISEANLITLSFGMNDSAVIADHLGTINDTGTDTVLGNVYNCIHYIQTQNPKCQIIVCGTTKPGGAYPSTLEALNVGLKDICAKYGIAFIDMHDQPFNQWNGSSSAGLTLDNIHYTDTGYILLAQYMCGKLSQYYGLK